MHTHFQSNIKHQTIQCPYNNNILIIFYFRWKRDYWHQKGEFSCCDGRNYTGEFKWGKKHGMGTQEYLREGDKGEVTPWQRMCIKGRDSMYVR